jgi:hypothetical protein
MAMPGLDPGIDQPSRRVRNKSIESFERFDPWTILEHPF